MRNVLTPFDDAATTVAVIASTQRWLERAVIGLNLCPFAKAVYVKRQIRYAVTAATTADALLAELQHELALLAQADPDGDRYDVADPSASDDRFHRLSLFPAGGRRCEQEPRAGRQRADRELSPGLRVRRQRARRHCQLHQPFAAPDAAPVARGAASIAQSPHFPTPPRSTNAISRRCAASGTRVGAGCGRPAPRVTAERRPSVQAIDRPIKPRGRCP